MCEGQTIKDIPVLSRHNGETLGVAVFISGKYATAGERVFLSNNTVYKVAFVSFVWIRLYFIP